MIFHKKIFQCVTAPIPLFLTPQKIGLLKVLCKQFVLKSEAVKNWRKKTRHSLFIDGNTYRSIFVHNYV